MNDPVCFYRITSKCVTDVCFNGAGRTWRDFGIRFAKHKAEW